MLDAPEVLKWNKARHPLLNILCVVLYLCYVVLVVGCVLLFGFIGALFGLARKS